MELAPLFESFLQHGRFLRNWSPKTVETYSLGVLEPPEGPSRRGGNAEGAPEISKARLEAWVVGMRKRGLSPGACNVYIRSINSFLSWLHENEHMAVRLKAKLLPNERGLLTPFSDAHVRSILAAKPKGFYRLRTWTLVNVLVDTGCRIDEALTLEVKGVDLESLTLSVMGRGASPGASPCLCLMAVSSVKMRLVNCRRLPRCT